ncbi:MAG: hypothetical protein WBD74_00285 [Candidatus Aquilonibacter sp.]
MAQALPPLDHVLTLTDDVGIIQHAHETVPDRSTGYCTDDVARALIVMLMRLRRVANDADALRLAAIYLAFLYDARLPDGRFHNFMSYGRAWLDEVGTQDSCGRAMWSLGYAARFAPHESWRRVSAQLLDRALDSVDWLEHPRAQSYAVLGITHALRADATLARTRALQTLTRSLVARYDREHQRDWEWFEPVMTYDNARLPEALLRAGLALDDRHLLETGRSTLQFLERTVFEDGIFVPIGNDGWFRRGGPRARFAQQPLEASAMVDAELAAFDAFADPAHRAAAAIAAAWYNGKNLLGATMAHGGGCYDGLETDGPNRNMGAESTLAYLAAVYVQE